MLLGNGHATVAAAARFSKASNLCSWIIIFYLLQFKSMNLYVLMPMPMPFLPASIWLWMCVDERMRGREGREGEGRNKEWEKGPRSICFHGEQTECFFLLIHSQTHNRRILTAKKKWKIKSIPSHIKNKFFSRFSMCVSKYSTRCIAQFWSWVASILLRFDVRLIRSIYSIIEHKYTHQQANQKSVLHRTADVMNNRYIVEPHSRNKATNQPASQLLHLH